MDTRSCLNKNGLKRSGLKLMRNRINDEILKLKNGNEQYGHINETILLVIKGSSGYNYKHLEPPLRNKKEYL